MSQRLQKIYNTNTFADLVVHISDLQGEVIHSIKLNRCIVCSCSEFFRALCGGAFIEHSKPEVNIPTKYPDIMKAVIESMYDVQLDEKITNSMKHLIRYLKCLDYLVINDNIDRDLKKLKKKKIESVRYAKKIFDIYCTYAHSEYYFLVKMICEFFSTSEDKMALMSNLMFSHEDLLLLRNAIRKKISILALASKKALYTIYVDYPGRSIYVPDCSQKDSFIFRIGADTCADVDVVQNHLFDFQSYGYVSARSFSDSTKDSEKIFKLSNRENLSSNIYAILSKYACVCCTQNNDSYRYISNRQNDYEKYYDHFFTTRDDILVAFYDNKCVYTNRSNMFGKVLPNNILFEEEIKQIFYTPSRQYFLLRHEHGITLFEPLAECYDVSYYLNLCHIKIIMQSMSEDKFIFYDNDGHLYTFSPPFEELHKIDIDPFNGDFMALNVDGNVVMLYFNEPVIKIIDIENKSTKTHTINMTDSFAQEIDWRQTKRIVCDLNNFLYIESENKIICIDMLNNFEVTYVFQNDITKDTHISTIIYDLWEMSNLKIINELLDSSKKLTK